MIAFGAMPALLPAHIGVSDQPIHHPAGTLPTPWHLCGLYANLCKGDIAHDFQGMPNYAVATGWWRGDKLLFGGGGAVAGVIFPNKLLNRWSSEQQAAQRLGVRTTSPGEPGWDEIITSNDTIKWAVLEDGSLVIMPKYVNGEEVPHSLLSGGEGVQAAGEAEISAASGAEPYGVTINRLSGHFEPSANSLEIGVQAFAEAGVEFAQVDPEVADG